MIQKPDALVKKTATKKQSIAIETLIDEHYAEIYRLALSILQDSAEADDAAQEVFVAAYKKLGSFRGEASLRTWLYRIGVNRCRSRLRKRKSYGRMVSAVQKWFDSAEPIIDPETEAIRNEVDANLWKQVDQLPDRHRLPIILKYVHDLTAPEIAAVLEVSEGTVYSRLHYAQRKLRTALKPSDNQTGAGLPR